MTNQYWLVKSEPETYSWADLVRDRKTDWTGVRNFAARNHLKAMKRGDSVFFYHSGAEKSVVGVAEVTKEAFPDPTAEEPGWVAVEIAATEPLRRAVSLDEIKDQSSLANMVLLRISRLSVQPVTAAEFKAILKLAAR